MKTYNTHIYSEGDPEYETWKDDWRLVGPQYRLMQKHLQHRVFDRTISIEDHDKCEFCYERFDAEDQRHPKTAYYCPSEHCWICGTCFSDFKEYFHWTTEDLKEDISFDPASLLLRGFGTIVNSDSRSILVCSCQHLVYYYNEAAKIHFSGAIKIGEWWGTAFQNEDEIWKEVKKRFDYLFMHPNAYETPLIHLNGVKIDMTALRNSRNELMGYFLAIKRAHQGSAVDSSS